VGPNATMILASPHKQLKQCNNDTHSHIYDIYNTYALVKGSRKLKGGEYDPFIFSISYLDCPVFHKIRSLSIKLEANGCFRYGKMNPMAAL